MELSVGLQACPSALSNKVSAASQTTWNAPVHRVTQCDMDVEAVKISAQSTLAAALSGSVSMLKSVSVGTDAAAGAASTDATFLSNIKTDPSLLASALANTIAAAALLESGATGEEAGGAGGMHAGRGAFGFGGDDGGMSLVRGTSMAVGGGGGPGGGGMSTALSAFSSQKYAAMTTPLERLSDFLRRAMVLCEHALGQNETLNIFRNELTLLVDDEVMVMGNGDAKHIREERQFMDLELTNNKGLSAIEWHPKSLAWLAMAAVPRLTYDQRLNSSTLSRPAHILLYTLSEFSNQLVRAKLIARCV